MELRDGYKQTEVGVIPDDWRAVELPKIIWFQEGPGLRQWQFRDKGLKVINVTNLQENGFLDLEKTHRHISWEEFDKLYKHFLIDENDVVMASSGNSYCKTSVVRKIDLPLLMNTSVIRFKSYDKLSYQYMLIYLQSDYFKNQIDFLITGGAQPNFGPYHLRKINIPLPPTKDEQTAIATALSDTDALIQSLTKLIDKKRNIKQGAMQELLKPKEGWVVKKLDAVATLKARIGWQGLTTAEYKKTGDYFLITGTDFSNGFIDWRNCHFVKYERYKQDKNIQVKENDVLVTKDGTIGKVAFIKSLLKPATLNSGVFVIRPVGESFYPEFFYYILMSRHFTDFLSQLAAGSTISHLYQKDFAHFKFPLPATIENQACIATILSDMDKEIAALETKLMKYKQIKQGMMQELLTGRIRLI